MIQARETLTPRETMIHDWEVDERNAHMAHEKEIRQLEIEVMKIEAKWSSWFKIPLTILKLPVYILFGVAYIVAVARKHEPSENFWKFLK